MQKSTDTKAQQRLQMADIARLAGVSTSTVSRALSGSPLVNQETRTRVMELARSLNYSINIGAQNLRLKQNRTVGVVVPYDAATRQHLSDPFFLGMLGSLADALTEQGFDMLVSRVDAETLDAAALSFDSGRVIGIILIGQWRHHDQLNQLAARQVPIVVWGAQLPQQLYCTVGGDNVAGGRLATEHLLTQGRRRIAFFGDINLPEVAQRHQGYLDALAAHGVARDEDLYVAGSFLPQGGTLAVQQLLERGLAFDAIFACSDLLAMSAISALRQHGLPVPEQVAVVGYDDIELAAYFHPPLSTVRQPMRAAGRALVSSLLALVDGAPLASQQLPTELVVRASSTS
ncbi:MULTISPECIES: LacI family DNA-binding transcriptional regulator [unclassified Janthinobacterium]|uniref:LacI family DNA-binding transcriptional regulator n=1 Tax=unclassified Janthinobacterium TaxID=2610881 RepID=UPI00160EEA1F|nr:MULTISPECIES: LacI family DNA-binding transcriptional regulator [unclassified Janthinobacterium]MBB5371188.1 DNA-binding LacI/PurR family transcriptional regulator [Janthinobacterium sp. K2C7]MBB5383994.1 DNA-binding LacI/PurR family transcriptional regulator [Janthinobacterium sp. K2Li3]MBB5389184.1 DNA-binding LacI/PurR family transcriptional regulator [Janthinobacterium sp. K2E3]